MASPPRGNGHDPDAPVALHKKTTALRPRRPAAWLDAIISRPDAAKVVRALPEQEVYYAIRELGLNDSLDLLRLCSPEQVRACLDIDCWQKDRLDHPRLIEWLETLLELGHERVGRIIEALDHEMLVTFLQEHIRVHEIDPDQEPDEPEGQLWATPDRFYLIDVLDPGHGGGGAVVQRLLEMLYMADLDLGRRVIMGAKWDLGAETEEAAYRFRSARMADLGYADYYEALAIYKPLELSAVRLTEQTAPPLPEPDDAPEGALLPPDLTDTLYADRTALGRTLGRLGPAQRERLLQHLLTLLNQALSADRIDPADVQAARRVMLRTAGTLSLGLEYLSRPIAQPRSAEEEDLAALPPEGRAMVALRNIALPRLFRLGHSVTLQLCRLAALLVERGVTTLLPGQDPASLLLPPHGEVVRLLLPPTPRPLYSRLIEEDPGAVGGRPFSSLLDVARTAAALEEVKVVGEFLTLGLGLRKDSLAAVLPGKSPALPELRLHDLLGTMAANLLLRRPPAMVPLSRADLPALRQAALGLAGAGPTLTPAARGAILVTLKERVAERSLSAEEQQALWPPAVDRFIDEALERLGRSLAQLPQDLSPELADAVPVVTGLVLQ